ncbi:glyoxysomal fatty acid beta-oxidation multifunctional protein MFP-a isoform X3 [Sesamum indicum]|uniref:enoyl-CoA hydratase n=1 Tax=Sesamum indicum TaxID=4182 RepID=A0A6I9THL1_SESIN|nr:glyoxysomal fatty acid beta-oxidation multifunctional protein MFP-a isoform X3 [Sesamum indicum]
MLGRTTVEVRADGVAVVTINNPPLNLLSVDVILSLKESIEGALIRDDVKAIVVTGSRGKFSAGFDVTAFGGSQGKKTKMELGFMSIQIVTDTLEAARKPFVAAIEGPAFGGGLEIALACHARISTSSAQLGLTELQYGILPGLGGTQRLPRLVGLSKALEMILMSKRVEGKEARTLSLVDAIAPADKLLELACQWALDIVECRRPWMISLYRTDKLETLAEARAILNSARLEVQRQNPNVVHPLVCIDVIGQGIVSGPRKALWKEAEALQELRQSSTCRSLVHVFFAQRQIIKIPVISKMNLLPRKIVKVAVVGGGLMSSEIATMLILSNYQVILKETNKKHLIDAISRVKENLQNRVKNGRATQEGLEKSLSLLEGVLDYDKFKDVDLVIEAESESLSLKQEIFSNLEKCCPLHCIFTSNISTFSVKLVGERTKSQHRIAGIHFFCLSPVMPLMEIVHTECTSPQVIVDLIDFGRKMRKTPIMVLKSFGMQVGPFRMLDVVGLQVFVVISKKFVESLPDRSYKSQLIPSLQQDNRKGERSGKGFYNYDNCGKASPDPKLSRYMKTARDASNVTFIDSELTKLSDSEIVEMILFPALNEACRMISDGVVIRSSDLDVASVLGMGFPAYRGGIIYWSDSFGSTYICSRLEKWSKEYGVFFRPCDYIMERSAKSISLQTSETRQAKSQL